MVSCTADLPAPSASPMAGKPGTYMSMASGATAVSEPSTATRAAVLRLEADVRPGSVASGAAEWGGDGDIMNITVTTSSPVNE